MAGGRALSSTAEESQRDFRKSRFGKEEFFSKASIAFDEVKRSFPPQEAEDEDFDAAKDSCTVDVAGKAGFEHFWFVEISQ